MENLFSLDNRGYLADSDSSWSLVKMRLKTGLFLISLVFLFGQLYGLYQMNYYLSKMGDVMASLPDLFWFFDASFTAWNIFFIFCFMFFLVFSLLFNCIPRRNFEVLVKVFPEKKVRSRRKSK